MYHRLWRKALGHEVIIYPNFWGQNSKIIFKSKRAQDHVYVIGFIEKMSNPSMLWESFEALKPKDMGRLTKSPMRIKRWNLFEPADQILWTKGKAHLRIIKKMAGTFKLGARPIWKKKKKGLNLWTKGKAHLKRNKKAFETNGKALMSGESEHSR